MGHANDILKTMSASWPFCFRFYRNINGFVSVVEFHQRHRLSRLYGIIKMSERYIFVDIIIIMDV